ncbi:hypothetical protein C8R45DRAFT_931361 [Mycena sanguinolenta]|nr:hypothetical protein C8R45DRAFT_931361 [Mycena sanguinolenta]
MAWSSCGANRCSVRQKKSIYIHMVNDKTAGSVRITLRLLIVCATRNVDVGYVPLVNLIRIFYQIRDDLLHLARPTMHLNSEMATAHRWNIPNIARFLEDSENLTKHHVEPKPLSSCQEEFTVVLAGLLTNRASNDLWSGSRPRPGTVRVSKEAKLERNAIQCQYSAPHTGDMKSTSRDMRCHCGSRYTEGIAVRVNSGDISR